MENIERNFLLINKINDDEFISKEEKKIKNEELEWKILQLKRSIDERKKYIESNQIQDDRYNVYDRSSLSFF